MNFSLRSKLFGLNKEYSDASFVEFILDEIPKRDYSTETKRNYTAQITKLQQFKKKLLFSEIINKSIG